MRFYEYESKALFRRHALPLGKSRLAHAARTRRARPRPRSAARWC